MSQKKSHAVLWHFWVHVVCFKQVELETSLFKTMMMADGNHQWKRHLGVELPCWSKTTKVSKSGKWQWKRICAMEAFQGTKWWKSLRSCTGNLGNCDGSKMGWAAKLSDLTNRRNWPASKISHVPQKQQGLREPLDDKDFLPPRIFDWIQLSWHSSWTPCVLKVQSKKKLVQQAHPAWWTRETKMRVPEFRKNLPRGCKSIWTNLNQYLTRSKNNSDHWKSLHTTSK